MQQRPLGRTGLTVGVLSLGTMTFGEQNTEAEGHAQLDLAVDHGVTLFDTAELYPIPPRAETQGRTSRIIGSWMKARKNRDRVMIATKVVGRTDMAWFRDGAPARLTRAEILAACDKELRNLGTDHVDLYQVHWPDRNVTGFGSNPTIWKTPTPAADEVAIEETLGALDDLVKAGKARHVGVSNESAWGTMRYLAASERLGLTRIASIQNAYHLVNRTFEGALAEIAEREQVSLLVYSSLAQGYLTDKYRAGALPAGARKTLFDRLQRYEKPGAQEAYDAYADLAREFGYDPSHMAIAFAASRSFVTTVLLGATSLDQLRHDLAAIEKAPMTDEVVARIDALFQRFGNRAP